MVTKDRCKIKYNTASRFVKPPLWDEKYKDFKYINGLKEVLPEGNESNQQISDTFDTDEMKEEDGWNAVIDLWKLYYKSGNSREAFKTWKVFKTCCKHGQSIDEYIMYYEKYKTEMQ